MIPARTFPRRLSTAASALFTARRRCAAPSHSRPWTFLAQHHAPSGNPPPTSASGSVLGSSSASTSSSEGVGPRTSLAFALGAGLCLFQSQLLSLSAVVDMECSSCKSKNASDADDDDDDDEDDGAESQTRVVATMPAELPGTKDASAAWVPPGANDSGLLAAQKKKAAEEMYKAVLAEVEESQRKECAEEDGDDGTPHYVPEHFRKELMGALDKAAPLSSTARYMLARESNYPIEHAEVTFAPQVPKPIKRDHPVHLIVDMLCVSRKMPVTSSRKYEWWPFGVRDKLTGKVTVAVPGPFIRARVGDVLQVNFTNEDESGMAHSIDFHSVCGPGGGSPTNFAEQDETKTGAYLLRKPGLYFYHCAAAPIPVHLHNGMFGLILVEPQGGLPPVDKEFYVVQHELYAEESDDPDERSTYDFDYQAALDERPKHIFFNGREGALVERPMMVEQNDRVRIYFANAGPNLISSIHLIGGIFDKVYREGDLVTPPAIALQSTMVPAGAAAVLETELLVPGSYSLIDHSIFRIDKGAVGMIKVKGKPRPDVYDSLEPPVYCPGCKTHQ